VSLGGIAVSLGGIAVSLGGIAVSLGGLNDQWVYLEVYAVSNRCWVL